MQTQCSNEKCAKRCTVINFAFSMGIIPANPANLAGITQNPRKKSIIPKTDTLSMINKVTKQDT